MESYIYRITEQMAKEMGYDEEKRGVLCYSLTMLVNNVQAVIMLFVISWLVGLTKLAFTAMVASALLRVASGGAHVSSSLRCSTIATIIFLICGFLGANMVKSSYLWILIIFLVVLGIYAIGRYAPADVPEKPIESKAQRSTLLRASWLIFVLEIAFVCWLTITHEYKFSAALTLGLTWQCFMITPLGYKLMKVFDSSLKYIEQKIFVKHSVN